MCDDELPSRAINGTKEMMPLIRPRNYFTPCLPAVANAEDAMFAWIFGEQRYMLLEIQKRKLSQMAKWIEGEVTNSIMAAKFNLFNDDITLTPLMIPCPSLQVFAKRSNMGSSQNRDDIHVLENLSTKDQ
ncbi:hypothetical protein BTVI_38706 [Pitangus sulphuratus]|nr:hypothetical protein BTVI_38706 [Pitangus sulphuratus]